MGRRDFSARLIVNPVLQLDCTVAPKSSRAGELAFSFRLLEESGKAQLEALLTSLPQI